MARISAGQAFGGLVFAAGMAPGVRQLFDNSFLTHLATGRLILDDGFPTSDPYTFTAEGLSWIPQSWLASVLYAGLEELGGLEYVRLVNGLITGLLALLGWVLVKPAGSVVRRMTAVAPFLLMGIFGWAHRPYLIGLACLAALLLVVEKQLDARWLLPVGWVWLNVHGSWPLAFPLLAALWLGRVLDHDDAAPERRASTYLVGGLALGALNPYGPRLFGFPLVAAARPEAFAYIKEWQPPDYSNLGQYAFLASLALAIVALRLRPSWRVALPVIAFSAAALVSSRNLFVASMVFLPLTAPALATRGAPFVPSRLFVRAVTGVAAALIAVSAITALGPEPFGDDPYPVAATDWLEDHHLLPTEVRVITHDYVGNWFEAEFGPDVDVFIDDRVEVIPIEVIEDYELLQGGEPGWDGVLASYEPAAVLWERDAPLAQLLDVSPCWAVEHADEDYVVAVPVRAPGCP